MCTKLAKIDKNFTAFKIKNLVVYDNGYRNNRNESSLRNNKKQQFACCFE